MNNPGFNISIETGNVSKFTWTLLISGLGKIFTYREMEKSRLPRKKFVSA